MTEQHTGPDPQALAVAIDHWRQNPSGQTASQLTRAAEMLNKRGAQLFQSNRIDEALTHFTLALRAAPDDAAAMNNAATCLKELGRLADSTALYRRALELRPQFKAAHSNILLNMHYAAGVTPQMLAAAHREWDERHAQNLRIPPAPSPAAPDQILRIGLVSSDLGQHPVGIFLVRYLENADPAQVNFILYGDGQRQDALADRIRAAARSWHDAQSLSDDALAQKIRADGINILLDLSGHTAANRLGVFARKPAPIQIGWLGYPGDNGLAAMDYVIGDLHILPLSLQPYTAAKILHLPDCFVCFDPPHEAPPVAPLQATEPGQVTFGCFHNPAKCGDEVIRLWADILTRLPQAKLRLKYKGFGEAGCRDLFEKKFAALGIDATRLEFQGASDMPGMFAAMQKVDIALDVFPFSGGLMSCLTLWMGIPLLTLPGETFASRQGLSFLNAIGITDTLAASRREYVEKAVTLANDLPLLAALRQRLRPMMAASPLCDGKKAASGLQNLLRQVWRDYCAASHA